MRWLVIPWLAVAAVVACGGGTTDTDPSLGPGGSAGGASTSGGAGGGTGQVTVGAGGGIVGCSAAGELSYDAPTAEAVSFAGSDGLELFGTLHIPDSSGHFATVILLHQNCSDRSDWTTVSSLAPDLAAAGFLVLSYDARGFGESTNGGQLDYCQESNGTLFEPMIADVGEAIAFLATRREANLDCLAVAGGSLGANVSLIYAADDPRVLTTVLFSPGLNYVSLSTQTAIERFDPRPSLMFATTEDTYSANTLTTLGASSPAATTVTLPGNAHGASILAAHPEARAQTLTWLAERL